MCVEETTEEGIDWLLAQTNGLRSFVEYVSEEIVDEVEIETAIATVAIKKGSEFRLRCATVRCTPYPEKPRRDGGGNLTAYRYAP